MSPNPALLTVPHKGKFSAYKLAVTDIRDYAVANSMQLSEFQLLDGAGVRFGGGAASGWQLDTGVWGTYEEPDKCNDGLTNTKCLSFSRRGTHIYIVFPYAISPVAYRIITANDFPERDPISWTVSGSNNVTLAALNVTPSGTWTPLATVTNYATPSARFTATADLSLP